MLEQKYQVFVIVLIYLFFVNSENSYSEPNLKRTKRNLDNFDDLFDLQCGQRLENISQPFIVNGRNAKYGEFPWHVGIYRKNKTNPNDSFKYICGGSIISETSVLTVAHCFASYDGTKIQGNMYSIGAGKYYNDYMSPYDLLGQKREVVDIEIHPQYKGVNSNYAWDIAVALLDKPFEMSDVVQPICVDLESQLEDSQLMNDNYGYIAGWGFTEKNLNDPKLNTPSEELKVLSLPFIERSKCLEVLPKKFITNVTPDKFCAGYTNGSSVCVGDSGSGLVFPKTIHKETRYFLRGLVSVGLQKNRNCDNFKYSTYTKISTHLSFFQDYVQNSCYTPNDELARCIPLSKCKIFADIIVNKSITPEFYHFITESECGNNGHPLVCCGNTTKYHNRKIPSPVLSKTTKFEHKNLNLLPSNDVCGLQDFQYNSLGGFITGLDEFPWTARLEFKKDTTYDRACAGVLINERYVLSSARCVAGLNGWNNRTLLRLRLGEYDLNTDLDCINTTDVYGRKLDEFCADPPLDIKVEKMIPHLQYRKPHEQILQNDIALIRLADKVNFTKYIRPICLPLHGETTKIGEKFILSDWPWFFYSELPSNYSELLTQVKQKANIPVLDFLKCLQNYQYTEKSNEEVSPSQICGGGLFGVDVCGSTAGPLMNVIPNTTQFYIEGIVSFGRLCGVEGVPSVYTRVTAFLEWILDNMEP